MLNHHHNFVDTNKINVIHTVCTGQSQIHENIDIYNKPSQRLRDMGISLLCVKYDTRHEASFASVPAENPFVTTYAYT